MKISQIMLVLRQKSTLLFIYTVFIAHFHIILLKTEEMFDKQEPTNTDFNNIPQPQYNLMPGQTPMQPMQPMQPNPFNQQMQPNQFSQPMQPNQFSQPMQPQMDDNPMNIAGGWGPMYFNVRDPSFTQRNDPVKQPPASHLSVVIPSIILVAWVVVVIIGLGNFLDVGLAFGLLAGIYVVYFLCSCGCSEIKEYINNMKPFDHYQGTYDQMVKGQGYFRFWIECYHYRTTRDSKGRTRRTKVVTHTANQVFTVSQSVDQSGEVQSIQDITSHVFIHYLKRYYFSDDASQQKFTQAFNSFVSRNRRDTHQNYSHNFDIKSFEEYVAFSALGDGSKSRAMFWVFLLLGLGLPFVCIFERTVSRYDIGILKRLTV